MMAKGMTFKWNIPPSELVGKVEVAINQALDATSIDIVNDIVVSLSIGAPPHSKPGDPPHTVTGEMKRSIGWDTPRHLMRRVGSGIGGGHPMAVGYPAFLEFGTKPHTGKKGFLAWKPLVARTGKSASRKMGEWIFTRKLVSVAPRPWLRPAMIRNRFLLGEYCRKFLGHAFRGGSFF